jgi:hypothetical protein
MEWGNVLASKSVTTKSWRRVDDFAKPKMDRVEYDTECGCGCGRNATSPCPA